MKSVKILLLTIISVFTTAYLAFLFVLPSVVDINQYLPQLSKSITESTGFKVNIDGAKIETAWNLSAGAFVKKAELIYPNGEKFAQVNDLQVRLSLIPLVFGRVTVDKVEMDKVIAELKVDKDGNFLIQKYIDENSKKLKTNPNIKFSDNMPDLKAQKYRFSIIDSSGNKYSLKGTDLKVWDFVLNKKIKIKSKGHLILNDRKQIAYDLALSSKVFPMENKGSKNSQASDLIKILRDLYNYNVRANIKTDLKISAKSGNVDMNGKINIDDVSFVLGGKIFPKSNIDLALKGDKIKIDSNLYTDIDSKAVITGEFKNGRTRAIDLKVKSDKVSLSNAVFIANTVSKMFGKKDLGIDANGLMKADFTVKSDFKKVESGGYLKIKDANIINKNYKVSMNAINADVDFSQDSVTIKKANAKLYSQPIEISGIVDKNANANILVQAKSLQLKGLLLATGNTKILKENEVQSGNADITAVLKGRLDKALPKVSVVVSNIKLKNNQSKTQIKISKVLVNTTGNKKDKGVIKLVGLRVNPQAPFVISAPVLNLLMGEKEINLDKNFIYINNIKTNVSGKISDINKNPRLNAIVISVPNQISMPISGYAGSKIIAKGSIVLNGELNNPKIKGQFVIPQVRIPQSSTYIKNATLQFDRQYSLNCPYVQIADSQFSFNALLDKDFSKGIVARNVRINSQSIDLNTLIPVFKSLPKSSNQGLTIVDGKSSIVKFKVGGLTSTNVTSDVSMQNNILYVHNMRADAYLGKVGGDINYDFNRGKVVIRLQGRGLTSNQTMQALTGRDDDIHGPLDFDSDISMSGYSKGEMLRTLSGHTNFIISNGKMGMLGKFEHLLYAQNVLSNNVFKATLGVIAKAVTVKNTGVYKYMKGKLTFSNGWANITYIKTSGPSMSLYMTGRYYLPDNTANLTILGRISDDVVRILGPLGEFSMDKAISSIPKLGEITTFFANQFTTNPSYENTSQIPYLTPQTEFPTKEFKVVIDGDVQKQSSVKSFKWLARPKIVQNQAGDYQPPEKLKQTVPDFVNRLPDFRN